jgi:hypothetical protein
METIDFVDGCEIGPDDGSHREISASEPICGVIVCSLKLLEETSMTESQKLSALRDRLIRRRRALVEGIQAASNVQLDGDELVRVQNEIEAVEKALAEEKRAEFRL